MTIRRYAARRRTATPPRPPHGRTATPPGARDGAAPDGPRPVGRRFHRWPLHAACNLLGGGR